ncbi:uncharacterized protein LAJ45_03139 [Morchella importuna]|uniref:uncharacterized protein n=1 Tax=Morchella importuna TaxID=1174673 RepID=UPI001E8CFFD0|nr:uncharacterized protein LAJ45_03139 [Morchella importuna]KAH8152913.1 hypothetical protein LAJ45_03139 [Morchella importuna]
MTSPTHHGGPPDLIPETAQSQSLSEAGIHVELTHSTLDITATLARVRSPKAGALILFAGTTRDNFDSKPVEHLSYTSYPPLALQTLLKICREMKEKHSLIGISIIHRLGTCPVGEESILVAVSAPHRKAAWSAGEECLEIVKEKAEIWKLETFVGGEGVWRANKDGVQGGSTTAHV